MHGATVVLLHGLLCDATVWAEQRVSLGGEHVVVPLLGNLISITAMAEHVLQHVPAGRFALAGHSMGGRVALEVVRLAPQRVERLALLDTGLDPLPSGDSGEKERQQRMALLQMARESGMRAMGQQWARGMVHPSRLDTPVFHAILDMIERNTPQVFEAQIGALLARPDANVVLADVVVPTLLVCGRQDLWSPLARHEKMRELLPAAHLVVVEDSGHMTTMEQPTAVSAALASWLKMD